MKFDAVYYEPGILSYSLGEKLKEDFGDIPWIPIESHNAGKAQFGIWAYEAEPDHRYPENP